MNSSEQNFLRMADLEFSDTQTGSRGRLSRTLLLLRMADLELATPNWFERQVVRTLLLLGWSGVRHVGASWDGGADVVGRRGDARWVVQVKANRNQSSSEGVRDLERAGILYNAQHGLAVARGGWTGSATSLAAKYGDRVQLYSGVDLVRVVDNHCPAFIPTYRALHSFQEEAVSEIQLRRRNGDSAALIAMATGLGKTVVAAEFALRSQSDDSPGRILVLAHSQDILQQSERSFWQHLPKNVSTHQMNGSERPFRTDGITFATFQTMDSVLRSGNVNIPNFDIVIVDECHHAGALSYKSVLESLDPEFLVGLTATPWRADEINLRDMFGDPVYSKSIVEAMNEGWLSEIDYRLLADNIPWDDLQSLTGTTFSIRQLNSRLFLPQLEDAIVSKLEDHWSEIGRPRALVFCKTIHSAERMSAAINARGFARAEALSSRTGAGNRRIDREIKLMKFENGEIDVLCGVDIFNEGIDVPDVNLLVFLRVTHSRRIFIQQLGRGLRWQEGKVVRVLDFVSDIRRIAAVLQLDAQYRDSRNRGTLQEVTLPDTLIRFGEDRAASFFGEWLRDLADLEDASERSQLSFPAP